MMDLSDYTLEPLHEDDNSSCELVISARRDDMGPDADVLVVVQDAGVDQLFEPLYTTKPDGLGLGLSISRSIIVAHGGRLWATPNARHGVTFQFVLPAWKGERP